MKNSITIFILLFAFIYSNAQNNIEPCYFDQYQRQHKTEIINSEKIISNEIRKVSSYKTPLNSSVKVIPVVVHVIHNGGVENISDAQIQSQIDVLNEDYRKIAGTNGDGSGVDTEVEFCLAKLTPDGKCTNGIVRIQSTLTNHLTYQRTQLKNLSYWDNTRYLNMYVVKTINGNSGIAGYSSFPGGPPDEDGIVVLYNYFGKTGTVAAASNGRTCSHELGHWFGLYHTFNGGCGTDTCADGDFVCDTPPAANPNFGCPTINSCSNDFPDVNDQIQNYLDYSDDACKSMFTAGQKTRMTATLNTLRTVIWSPSNITATGCDSGYVSSACNVIADFTSNSQNICVSNPVLFTNKSLNNPTTFQWYFTGGTPSTSTLRNPTISYNTVGTYPVKLISYGALGVDSIEMISYINVTTPPTGQALPFFEGFETNLFPPNGITIDNADAGITWERDTIAVQYAGMGSAKINNLINTNYGQSDAMILPRFDFTTAGGVPYLNFKWAYARSDANYSDELIVLVSKDCGVNWAQVFYKTGSTMTTGATLTTPYVPSISTVWKTANINLNTYITYSNVLIKIVNVTDGGNNLYIDNINLGASTTGINETTNQISDLNIFPNPAKDRITISLNNFDNNKPILVRIIDILGKEVFYSTYTNSKISLNVVSWSKGMYTINVTQDQKVIHKKIIVD
jgi:PKD repeat protein